jgi:hypothetical protein
VNQRLVNWALLMICLICGVNIVRYSIPAAILFSVAYDGRGLSASIIYPLWEISQYAVIALLAGFSFCRVRLSSKSSETL